MSEKIITFEQFNEMCRQKLINSGTGYCAKEEHKCEVEKLCETFKSLPTAPSWISVEDGLPEFTDDEKEFLIFVEFEDSSTDTYIATFSNRIKSWFIDIGGVHSDDITHWQPLPQPPKGEGR